MEIYSKSLVYEYRKRTNATVWTINVVQTEITAGGNSWVDNIDCS